VIKGAATILCFLTFSGLNLLAGQSKVDIPAEQTSAPAAGLSPADEAEITSVRE
jgi:hypothetical protein